MPTRRATRFLSLAAVALAACTSDGSSFGAFPEGWGYAQDTPPVTAEHGMVVTTDEVASRVGVAILQAGGNAVDAAIATGFALAVVNPEAGNLGGGGFMMVRLANGEAAALDYRECAPLAATRDMYLDAEGNVTDRSLVGHLAVGVPGTVMGMWEAHQRFGTLPWSDLVAPAIELADGFEVHQRFRTNLVNSEAGIRLFETTEQTYLRDGEIPAIGAHYAQPDLAGTLRRIQEHGADGFYRGETAELIVAEMERGGGIITREDLASYEAAWREPIRFTYRGHTVYSMPPSSSGGVTMAEMANMIEPYNLAAMGWHSPEMIHLMVESWRRAFSDRNEYLADPDFVEMPLERMASKGYAAERGSDILTFKATPSSQVGPGLEPRDEGENTTHFSIVDEAGNAVAVTTTLNSWFGSKVTVAGAGFVLNNEMDDFAAKPGTPNQFLLVQGDNNAIEPGKRMLSAMTPSIVLGPGDRLFLVTGTPGGATIITTVFQTIVNVIDYGMNVREAVNAPRVHHQHLPDQIFVEAHGLDPATIAELEALGHTVVTREGVSGDAQVIMVMPDGTLEGASDPRRGGKAVGY